MKCGETTGATNEALAASEAVRSARRAPSSRRRRSGNPAKDGFGSRSRLRPRPAENESCKDEQGRDRTSATLRMHCADLQQRMTRARSEYSKLLEFSRLNGPLWIRRLLVRSQEGQLAAAG